MANKTVLILVAAAAAIIIAGIAVAIPSFTQQTPAKQNNSSTNPQGNNTISEAPGSVLKLSRTSIPIDIPLRKGFYDGNEGFYVVTDASDKSVVNHCTNQPAFNVNYALLLPRSPEGPLAHFSVL